MFWTNLLLGLILFALGGVTWLLANILRREIPTMTTVTVDPGVRQVIEELAQATAHHVEISAMAEMVRQLDNDPSAVQHLKTYPIAVQRAALAHYADQLGQALQAAQKELCRAHKGELNSLYNGGRKIAVGIAQTNVDEIRAELDALVALAAQL